MNIRILLLIYLAFFLSGCGRMVAQVATSSMPLSEYRPNLSSESETDAYVNKLKTVNRKIIQDDLGSYYHEELEDGAFSVLYLAKEDEQVIRNLFSGSVGLLEPQYVYNKDTSIDVDWKETQSRYDYLTKTLHLKLLPISATKDFHENIIGFIKKRLSDYRQRSLAQIESFKQPNLLTMITDATKTGRNVIKGETGLYNKDYYKEVLKLGQFDYIVQTGLTEAFFGKKFNSGVAAITKETVGKHANPNSNPDYGDINRLTYSMLLPSVIKSSSIEFVPLSVYKYRVEGMYRFNSSCSIFDAISLKELMKESNQATDIPYFSAINVVLKSKDKSSPDFIAAQQKFMNAVQKSNALRQRSEKSCLLGLHELGISGKISSEKLK